MRSTNVTLHGSFSWSLYFCNFVICLGIRFSILSVFPLTRFRYRVLTQLIKAVLCVSLNPIPPARVVDSPIKLRVRVRCQIPPPNFLFIKLVLCAFEKHLHVFLNCFFQHYLYHLCNCWFEKLQLDFIIAKVSLEFLLTVPLKCIWRVPSHFKFLWAVPITVLLKTLWASF